MNTDKVSICENQEFDTELTLAPSYRAAELGMVVKSNSSVKNHVYQFHTQLLFLVISLNDYLVDMMMLEIRCA